jgi:predicted LPLAT superfamily acyltransferase
MIAAVATKLRRAGEALGHQIFYVTLRLTGQRGAYALLVPVVATYTLLSRHIHRATAPYVRRRFPAYGRLRRWWATFRIVHSFGQVLVDRAWLGLDEGAQLGGTIEGYERLKALIARGDGLVLSIAHVGNWQAALGHLPDLGVPVHALMDYRGEQVAKHFFDLRDAPFPLAIIHTDGFLGGAVEASAVLRRGEILTVMGDRFVKGRSATAALLGAPVRLPTAAFTLAASTGAPVAVLLSAKTARRRYVLRVWDVIETRGVARAAREAAYAAGVGRFARSLEEYLQKYPHQWYNFFDFWRQ